MSNMSMVTIKKTLKNIFNRAMYTGRNYVLELCGCVLMAVVVFVIAFPAAVNADQKTGAYMLDDTAVRLAVEAMQNKTKPHGTFPQAKEAKPHAVMRVPITAYSSEVGQTDSTPFITASGARVRDGIVAANFLPIGTKVRIPELYGKKVFVVEDRMNKRYWKRMDIWMAETEDAKQFGVKRPKIEIFYQ